MAYLRHESRASTLETASRLEFADPLTDDDLHLALYMLYEFHYRGFAGVDDGVEWDPVLLAFRRRLERAFEGALRDVAPTRAGSTLAIAEGIRELIAGFAGPSLSTYMESAGTIEQFREFAIHRSAYQLKEADPHTWAIPRLSGEAKAALVTIQKDEYGNGDCALMHNELFATTMQALGLDATYGAYVDVLPGRTLATVNLVSLFGLHRRWRGALVGHLAVFEMCSVTPMRRYANALRRLGIGDEAIAFFDTHVEADAVHETVATTRLVGGFALAEPELATDVLFGAAALLAVEDRFARHLLTSWAHRTSSLRARPAGVAA